jgi:hypothetical protein
MAYFSNSTEGQMYQERYCYRCVHYRDKGDGRGDGCPVWDAHMQYNGDRDKEGVLDLLIPQSDGGNDQCEMFLAKEEYR